MSLSSVLPSPTLSVLYSECILSLYPILLKMVPTTLYTQWLARFLTFPALSFLLGPTKDITSIWTNPYEASVASLNGLLHLLHVGVSYTSYQLLPAGTALSLFYLYPLWNVLAGALFFGETLSPLFLFLLLLSLVGVYLLSRSPPSPTPPSPSSPSSPPSPPSPPIPSASVPSVPVPSVPVPSSTSTLTSYQWGIIMGLLAGLTETMIFIFVRWNHTARASPFYTVNHLYPFGLFLLLWGAYQRPSLVDTTPTNWMYLLGFNALLGFTGYIARFYSISRLPTILFSLLSFMGVFFGHVWGKWFIGEMPSASAMVGSALIVLSVGVVRWVSSK
jgi:drug/metabolite transporter (DMT)-like permease